MRIVTWNLHGAKENSPAWEFLSKLNADIILLQEVGTIPEIISQQYAVLSKNAIYKNGEPQKFSTSVLVRGMIVDEISILSEFDWVNSELEFFSGNLIACSVQLPNNTSYNVVSVYSPAWSVDPEKLRGVDVSKVKLELNPKVWVADLLWSALRQTMQPYETWIVGGDFNSSETFDIGWQKKHGKRYGLRSNGNGEMLQRMNKIGFKECLRTFNDDNIIPTFKHSGGEIAHQIDHLFVTDSLYSRITNCTVADRSEVFERNLSDHLPIISDFSN